jgi:hypothetical protein
MCIATGKRKDLLRLCVAVGRETKRRLSRVDSSGLRKKTGTAAIAKFKQAADRGIKKD